MEKVWQWVLFTACVTLLPMLFKLLIAVTDVTDEDIHVTLPYLLAGGELLVSAVGLSAAASGDLLITGQEWGSWRVIVAGICLLNTAIAAFYFALVYGSGSTQGEGDVTAIVIVTFAVYGVALACSGSCLALSADEEEE